MKIRSLLLLSIIVPAVLAHAQIIPPVEVPKDQPVAPQNRNPTAGGTNAKGIWQATLPGGEYAVSTDRITSVSRHSYLLDGTLLVDEVTIDTTGVSLHKRGH